jgi:hypothetical protein
MHSSDTSVIANKTKYISPPKRTSRGLGVWGSFLVQGPNKFDPWGIFLAKEFV